MKKGLILFGIQILSALVVFLVLAIVMDTSDSIIYDTSTVMTLLQGYERWYNTILIVCLVTGIVVGVINLIVIGLVAKGLISEVKASSKSFRQFNRSAGYLLGCISFALFPIGILTMTVLADGTLENADFATADISAIETGNLVTLEIEHFGDGIRARLPEPTGGNVENSLRRFNARTTDGRQIRIYVLENEYSTLRDLIAGEREAQRVYGNETGNRDISSHIEVVLTPNFNLITEFTSIRVGWE